MNILYGHTDDLEPPDLPALTSLSSAASDAYVRLITGHKRMRRESQDPPIA